MIKRSPKHNSPQRAQKALCHCKRNQSAVKPKTYWEHSAISPQIISPAHGEVKGVKGNFKWSPTATSLKEVEHSRKIKKGKSPLN
jgi:hypothetical protein